jgi:RNA polymerase sigma-70 factor (ECF subfamily)
MGKDEVTRQSTSDETIVDMYWQRNPDAIQETDQKYGRLLHNVAYNILRDAQDCEECQNDTYFRIWNSIPGEKPKTFQAFAMQIIRRIAIDRYRVKSSKKRIPSQLTLSLEDLKTSISSGCSVEEAYDAKMVGDLITEYIRGLTDRQKYIFMDRYYMAEPIEKTAADLDISVRTAFREVEKIKQGLKEFLERNGVYV